MNTAHEGLEVATDCDDEPTCPGARWTRVLLVEDDEDLRAFLAHGLRRAGYEVIEAGDGSEALDQIGSALMSGTRSMAMPDLVVTDLRMPVLDGLNVVCGLRGAAAAMPILMITAADEPEMNSVVMRLGANGILRKPFSPRMLASCVMDFVGPPQLKQGTPRD